MNASNTDETTHADTLREAMISKLREMGAIRSDRVADAFHVVPRHSFAPGAPLEAVYAATDSVVVKRDEHDIPISTVSAPEFQDFILVLRARGEREDWPAARGVVESSIEEVSRSAHGAILLAVAGSVVEGRSTTTTGVIRPGRCR
jgi:hypothetical protein